MKDQSWRNTLGVTSVTHQYRALKSWVRKKSPGEGHVHLEAGAELRGTLIFNG